MKRATLYFKYFMLYNIISIHALVKRATGFEVSTEYLSIISIHALVKRATSEYPYLWVQRVKFQSTPS